MSIQDDVKAVRALLSDIPDDAIKYAAELSIQPSLLANVSRILDRLEELERRIQTPAQIDATHAMNIIETMKNQNERYEKALDAVVCLDSFMQAYEIARKALKDTNEKT